MGTFADEWEEKAHGVICLIKFNGVGGSVDTRQMQRVADYLRGHSLKPKLPPLPRVALPPLPSLPLPPLPLLPK